MATWEESLQGWLSKGLDIYGAQQAQDAANDYEVERLRLLQRNPYGQPYYEGQAVGAVPGQPMSQGVKTALLIGGALLVGFVVLRA
jgi:hypothetical protein